MIPEREWRWFGHAGHLVVANYCRFHLHTRVGDYRISTVGDYWPDPRADEPTEIGYERLYETYVFRLAGECPHCDPDCGQGEVVEWSEIDSLPANNAPEAEQNHLALCHRYAQGVEVPT